MKLTNNFSLAELTHSETAERLNIENSPSVDQIDNLRKLCENILQPARDRLNDYISVTSGLRVLALNRAVGSKDNSQHPKGEAADVKCRNNANLFELIRSELSFDQLIWEFGDDNQPKWIHVSFKGYADNRNQALRAIRENGKVKYINYEKDI